MDVKSVLKSKLRKAMGRRGDGRQCVLSSGEDEGKSKGSDRVVKGGKERYYVRFLYLCSLYLVFCLIALFKSWIRASILFWEILEIARSKRFFCLPLFLMEWNSFLSLIKFKHLFPKKLYNYFPRIPNEHLYFYILLSYHFFGQAAKVESVSCFSKEGSGSVLQI